MFELGVEPRREQAEKSAARRAFGSAGADGDEDWTRSRIMEDAHDADAAARAREAAGGASGGRPGVEADERVGLQHGLIDMRAVAESRGASMRKDQSAQRTQLVDDTFRDRRRLVPAPFIRAANNDREQGMRDYRAAARASIGPALAAPTRNRKSQEAAERAVLLFDDFAVREGHVDGRLIDLGLLEAGSIKLGEGKLRLATDDNGKPVEVAVEAVLSYVESMFKGDYYCEPADDACGDSHSSAVPEGLRHPH